MNFLSANKVSDNNSDSGVVLCRYRDDVVVILSSVNLSAPRAPKSTTQEYNLSQQCNCGETRVESELGTRRKMREDEEEEESRMRSKTVGKGVMKHTLAC